MRTRFALTMEDARTIAEAAECEARENGWEITVAVCDEGGHLLWLQRMDGANPLSAQVAPEKARASVLARKPSKALEDMVNGGRYAALAMPLLPLEGGEMIVANGDVVGGVGVSGVKASQDAQVAQAGVRAVEAAAQQGFRLVR